MENEIAVDVILDKADASERACSLKHIENFQIMKQCMGEDHKENSVSDIILFDRGYFSSFLF